MLAALILALALATGWAWTPDLDRAALEARHAAPPSRFVELAGLRVHLRDTGPRDAPPVLLLHGFGASLHTWDAWAGALEAGHRVIRLDLPGAALTGPDPAGGPGDGRALQVVVALLDALEVPPADVVGHSMGGRLAWQLAAQMPERVRRLVLIAPEGFAAPGAAIGGSAGVPLAARLLPWMLPRPLLREALAAAWGDPGRLDEATVDRYHELLRVPGLRAAMVERLETLPPVDPLDAAVGLRRVEAPVLLLWGERDALVPPARAADFERELPHARRIVLPGVGHVPQEEAPETSLAAVRGFLRD